MQSVLQKQRNCETLHLVGYTLLVFRQLTAYQWTGVDQSSFLAKSTAKHLAEGHHISVFKQHKCVLNHPVYAMVYSFRLQAFRAYWLLLITMFIAVISATFSDSLLMYAHNEQPVFLYRAHRVFCWTQPQYLYNLSVWICFNLPC